MGRTALSKRLGADAWQHLLAGHLFDFAREKGRWIIRMTPDEVFSDRMPDRSDKEFVGFLQQLPDHGQPIVVPGEQAKRPAKAAPDDPIEKCSHCRGLGVVVATATPIEKPKARRSTKRVVTQDRMAI